MIIDGPDSVTEAVLSELKRAPDPRFREVMSAFVRHLHAFIREVRLTEEEFQAAVAAINAIGKATNDYHNEGVLMAGSLGVSPLVCLSTTATDRPRPPRTCSGRSGAWNPRARRAAARSSARRRPARQCSSMCGSRTAGGKPVAGAEVDVWHSSTEGYYENQDPSQADMNLRGKFTTDADGHFAFRSVKPAGYPIPVDGPTGDLLRAQGRHNMRPAHLHFLIYKPGFKTHVSQVYVPDDPYIDSDVQFGVTRTLLGNYVRHEDEPAPAPDVKGPWYSLDYTFYIQPGQSRLPRAPIHDKAKDLDRLPTRLQRTPDPVAAE